MDKKKNSNQDQENDIPWQKYGHELPQDPPDAQEVKTETDEIMAELESEGIYEFSASRTVEVMENGEVEYNDEGLHKRVFKDVRHFGEWLDCGHRETESNRPVREYLYNREKSLIADGEVWDEQEKERSSLPNEPVDLLKEAEEYKEFLERETDEVIENAKETDADIVERMNELKEFPGYDPTEPERT